MFNSNGLYLQDEIRSLHMIWTLRDIWFANSLPSTKKAYHPYMRFYTKCIWLPAKIEIPFPVMLIIITSKIFVPTIKILSSNFFVNRTWSKPCHTSPSPPPTPHLDLSLSLSYAPLGYIFIFIFIFNHTYVFKSNVLLSIDYIYVNITHLSKRYFCTWHFCY